MLTYVVYNILKRINESVSIYYGVLKSEVDK